MVNEFVAEGGKDVSIDVKPGVGGVLQVFVDGDKIYDKSEEGGQTPHLNRVKELRAIVRSRLDALVPADDN
ncbi:MAG: Rdx family protein [Dehalococcoidia bacterium]|nr:Rdx family protein [Dehalococcoidia bacterium]